MSAPQDGHRPLEQPEDLFEEEQGLFEDLPSGVEPAEEPFPVLHADGRDSLEALIFAAAEPLETPRLAALLEWEPTRVEEALAALNADYFAQGRAFELRRLAGGWQLVARRAYAPLLRRLLKENVRPRLSRAALETLAVVAFRQPVTKGEIEAVRGVKADAVLRTLLERDLVMIGGRSEGVGRPLLYRTTRGFLEAFGLASLQELPRLKEIQAWLKGPRDRGPEHLPPLPLAPFVPPVDETEPAAAPDLPPAAPTPEEAQP